MSKIFICYRRDDSGAACGRIYEHLCNHFGRGNVFKDVDATPWGVRFPDHLAQQLTACRIELVLIGRFWLTLKTADGTRRLDAPDDFVRTEIETGLRSGKIVVPLPVDNATMPHAVQLPASIRELVEFQGAQVRNDPDFDTDMQRLIRQVEGWLRVPPPADTRPTPGATVGGVGESQDAAMLQAQIEKLLQEVSAVGDGDLRVQAEVTPDTLGVLADSFNYMIEELAKVVGRVQATTFQVTNGARRLLDRFAEVADASQTQAYQTSQTMQAVAQLADFVQLTASNAISAAEAARETLRNAEGGQHAVVQTIDGMVHIRENVQETSKKIKRLGERSQEVGEIVRLVEDVADQTNLLALNAAIQSATAGEHGRGFAVVAEEIRMLAERVTEATKRIATLVKGIQGDTYAAVVAMEESTQEVVNGSRFADEAGEALRRIYSVVDHQAQMIEDIARAAGERTEAAEKVASAMSRLDEITSQTNTAMQDASAGVMYLAELAEQLRASVATFRLSE
ncbi:MAG: Methyl-accepting chemotaxis protein [Ktedonobacterales bacterium]|nr:MAG: Methyl-accepting chemotaxis protein [Ktedonobacterales bacterium]